MSKTIKTGAAERVQVMLTILVVLGIPLGISIGSGAFAWRDYFTWVLIIVLLLSLWASYRLQKQLDDLQDSSR